MEIVERKLKVYLDTSVISYLFQEDCPEKMAETREVWEYFKRDEYEIFISNITLEEIDKCYEEKRFKMLKELSKIRYTLLQINNETEIISSKIINLGILSNKSKDDVNHISIAIVGNCDCILSWNFKHIVNIKTIKGIRSITNLSGYKPIEIWQPSVLLDEKEDK